LCILDGFQVQSRPDFFLGIWVPPPDHSLYSKKHNTQDILILFVTIAIYFFSLSMPIGHMGSTS
jgi:hypothetical protein